MFSKTTPRIGLLNRPDTDSAKIFSTPKDSFFRLDLDLEFRYH